MTNLPEIAIPTDAEMETWSESDHREFIEKSLQWATEESARIRKELNDLSARIEGRLTTV